MKRSKIPAKIKNVPKLLSPQIHLCWIFHINGIIQNMPDLFYLAKCFFRFIHYTSFISRLCPSFFPSYLPFFLSYWIVLPGRSFPVAGHSWQLPPRPSSPCTVSPEVWRPPCRDWSLIFLHSPMVSLTLPTLWTEYLSFSSNSSFQVCILLPAGSLTDTGNKQNSLFKTKTNTYMHKTKV